MAPWVSSGHSENAMLAEAIISCITTAASHGNPPPPNSPGNGTAPQPASTYCRYASLNPAGADVAIAVQRAADGVADRVERRDHLTPRGSRPPPSVISVLSSPIAFEPGP
jgi:hypothetical protein